MSQSGYGSRMDEMLDDDNEASNYLNQHNLHSRLKEAILELVHHQPERPYAFLRDFFERIENNENNSEPAPRASLHNIKPDHEEKDEMEVGFVPPGYRSDIPSRDRRGAISAEVYHDEEIKNFSRKVVPKDYKTMQALQRVFENIKLLKSCDEDQRSHIFDAMAEQNYSKGDVIIKQGDPGNYFYVIDSGEVEVTQNAVVVATIGEWGTFGELALMHGQPRLATVTATSDRLKLWAIDRHTYRKILMSLQKQKREKYDQILKKMKILNSLQDWERLTVADALESVSFEKGDCIVRQNDTGNEFFIIIEGTADITKTTTNGTEHVGELGPSDFFGELALILSRPRAATVKAKTFVKCVKLDRNRFERVMGPIMDILKGTEYYKEYVQNSV